MHDGDVTIDQPISEDPIQELHHSRPISCDTVNHTEAGVDSADLLPSREQNSRAQEARTQQRAQIPSSCMDSSSRSISLLDEAQ